jgi:hypothetical protein
VVSNRPELSGDEGGVVLNGNAVSGGSNEIVWHPRWGGQRDPLREEKNQRLDA